MYDLEKVNYLIKEIEKEFALIREFKFSETNLNNSQSYYATSMAALSIITKTIDLAEHIIIRNDWGMPSAYGKYFEVLNSKGMIGEKLSKILSTLSEERNKIAHQYDNMKRREMLKIIDKLYSVREFIEKVKKEVERNEKRNEK